MTKHEFIFMELPMNQVERDPNQPRKDFGAEGEKNKLKASIKSYGISGLVPNRQNLQGEGSHKEEEINEFLMQLNDAADNRILVVGATNFIDRIDPAVLRPGRMDKKVYVSPPDFEARKELFKLGLSGRPYDKNIDFEELATKTEGFTSADIIEGVVEGSARIAANLNDTAINQELLEKEMEKIQPVVEENPKIGFGV